MRPPIRQNKIHFTSLGCARNLVDTEVMLGLVLQAGFEATDRVEEADVLVVNTCGYLEIARKESCDTIATLLAERKEGAKLVVAGCMVQKNHKELKEQFPEIHYLLGSGDMERILEAIGADEAGSAVTSARSYLEWGEVPRQPATPKHYAYLKIAEGCAKRCAFCIIPVIKGPLRSKTHEQVLKEFKSLLDRGVYEVILIAQDLGDYGKDRKEKEGLVPLLKEMLKEKRDFWLRLLYLYPDEVTDDLISLMQTDGRLLPYLDMPIQHISDAILKPMRRKTSKEQIVSTLNKLRTSLPQCVIRTSLMVGFPGETEEHFQELLDFVKEFPLDNVGIFKYSKEEGSRAATYSDQVAQEVKEERFERLAAAQLSVVKKGLRRFIGKRLKVVIEGYHPETELLMRGRFYGQCPEVDGQIIINDPRGVSGFGRFYDVEITDVMDYDLVGRVVSSSKNKKLSVL